MLDLMRRKAQSKLLQVIILIIILVFIFWGVGSNQGGVQNAVATVNGESITFQDFQKEYDQTVTRLRDQLGGTIPQTLLDTLNLDQTTLNSLIQQTLLRQGAAQMGLMVSDAELRDAIQGMEAFKSNGVFDVAWYEQVLTSSRMTVSKFEANLRYDLLAAKIVDHLSRFGSIPQAALEDFFRYQYGKTKLQYVKFDAANFTDKVDVNEKKLAASFEEHKGGYMTPPQVKLHYLAFSFGDSTPATPPDEAQIAQYYEGNKARYTTQEERRARHILIKSTAADAPDDRAAKRKKAEDLLEQIKKGAKFADLAKKHSEDGSAAKGGDLGFFRRGQMVPPFEAAAFALKAGETSAVVETQFGFHLIQMEEIKEGSVKGLDAVKTEIATLLSREGAKTATFQKANDAYEQIILAGSLAKYASAAQGTVSPVETDFFTQDAPPESLRDLPEAVNAAFGLKKGELSSIIETAKGYVILFLADNRAPEPQPFDAVKDKVKTAYIAQESARLAKTAAEELLAKLTGGEEFTTATAGLVVTETPFLSRSEPIPASQPSQIIERGANLSAAAPILKEVVSVGTTSFVVAFKEG